MLFPRIYATQSPVQAGVVIGLLRAYDFHPIDLQMSPSILFGGADLWYHVQVPPEEVMAAIAALKEMGYGDEITDQSDKPNTG